MIPKIHTERTCITVLQREQSNLLLEFQQQNKVFLAPWEPLRDETFFTEEACHSRVKDSFNAFEQGVALPLVALCTRSQRVIATCNFSNIIRGVFQACHFGYAIDQGYEGQGIMTEVLEASIDYVFSELKLHRVMANYMLKNVRSGRLLQRLGFEKEGVAREYLKINGQWQDHILTAKINTKNLI